ncbi:MAG: D-2-hydroxyacid dehydrogenase family protein [Actinomycetota bacterium]|nr:D-2-hydroxyacid dehydrogenase family protein [Actinomycetota bacterium]MDA3001800.1 D-2-hydroxyacid dehydrogenase family protein [Actinomycetota bacterium]
MPVKRIVVLDDYQNVALKSADWSGISYRASIEVRTDHLATVDELVEVLSGAQIVVVMRERTRLDAQVIDRLPSLELIVTTGPTNAAIDTKHAWDRGIFVCGTGGYVSPTIELTFALMLGVARSIVHESNSVAMGGWQTQLGLELAGKRLGLVGLGRIGGAVATIARAFGMDVIAWSQNLDPRVADAIGVRAVSKRELFETSDVVSVHLVLSDRSRGLVGEEELKLMKSSAILINTSRGPIIEESALVTALRSGSIGGAGIDVFDVEPLGQSHPLRELARTHPRLVLTPHIGYVTDGLYRQFFAEVVEDIEAWLDDQAIRVVS